MGSALASSIAGSDTGDQSVCAADDSSIRMQLKRLEYSGMDFVCSLNVLNTVEWILTCSELQVYGGENCIDNEYRVDVGLKSMILD